jgi:hypothetical protein
MDPVRADDRRDPPWWAPASLLTAPAAAIAAFTFAVLSLVGDSTAGMLVQAIVGFSDGPVDFRWVTVAPAVVSLLLALGAVLLGRKVVRATTTEAAGWAGQLARASVVVAAVGAGFSVAAIVAGLLRG